jgi:hypothetical protein
MLLAFSNINASKKTPKIAIKLYVIILLMLKALLFNAKNIGKINPKTLLDAIINALNIVKDTGINFFLRFPSSKK